MDTNNLNSIGARLHCLLRLTLGKKFAAAFALFLLLTAGNLLLTEHLYDSIVDVSKIVNESGRLRYLSQKIAYRAAKFSLDGDNGEALKGLAEEYDGKLVEIERATGKLSGMMLREGREIPRLTGELRRGWVSYRDAAQTLRLTDAPSARQLALERIYREADGMLIAADKLVNELTQAVERTHDRIDLFVMAAFLFELAFIGGLYFLIQRRIARPIQKVSRLFTRFAAGEHTLRYQFDSFDEIGDLVRSFNQTTERMAALISEMERLTSIFDITSDYVGIATLDRKLLYINRAGRKMVGIGADEDISVLTIADVHPAWVAEALAKVGLVSAARDGVWQGESVLLSRDGREIPVSQVIMAHKSASGTVEYFSTVIRDISERIAMETRLIEGSEKLDEIMSTLDDVVWSVSPETHEVIYQSPAAEKVYGYSAQAFHDNPNLWAEVVHPDDYQRVRPFLDELLIKGELEMEYRIVRPGGEVRWLYDRARVIRDAAGKPLRFDGIASDVTARHQANEKLRKLSRVIENIGSSVVITDNQGIIEYVNPFFTQVTGYAAEEALGKTPRILKSGFHNQDEYRQLWETLLDGREWRGELLNRKKNGEFFWESEVISPVRDERGIITHFVAVKEDISLRKKTEENLRLWQRAIEASLSPILITDATQGDNPLLYVNPAFERVTGYRAEEAIGRNVRFLQGEDKTQAELDKLRRAINERHEGRAVLRNYRKDGSLFWNELYIAPVYDEYDTLTNFIGVQNDITEQKRYEEQLEHQASHDALTNLPNRNLLRDRVDQAIAHAGRSGRIAAVLFLDLDQFKFVNDSLGHDAGDRLLVEVAERLKTVARLGDTVARLGGDEFVIVLSDVEREEDVASVAHKLLDVLQPAFAEREHELYITASVGIALYPRDGENVATLLKNADVAMYRAKDEGRNNFQYFATEMNARASERLALEGGLRHALERGELVLYYQPQLNLRTGRVIGMEALVRWRHPDLGLVPPGKFIPLAEETGLIVPIGAWVLREACAQNKAWQDAGLPPLVIAVNLSARQFRSHDLLDLVKEVLAETGLESRFLELELTESMIMHDPDRVIQVLRQFSDMGVSLSVDDFGTGYSSLSYLKRFPIDKVKIDQSFVHDITTDTDDASIAKTIISIAHDMKMQVIAEGVETEGQASFLRNHHCDEMQGYLFSKPVPAEEFEQLLREGRCIAAPEGERQALERTLLLVDDEGNILTALNRLLRSDGYKILMANSASAGLELLAENKVGVILSDQRMPEMSGVEFLHKARQLYPDTMRIVLSGYADLKSVTAAINEGSVYKFLTKPWEDDLLRGHIREAFERYEMLRENERLLGEIAQANEALSSARRKLEQMAPGAVVGQASA